MPVFSQFLLRNSRCLLAATVALLTLSLEICLVAAQEKSARQIAQLIEKLGSKTFEERDQASAALIDAGPPALSALRAALKSSDAEIAKRAKQCIEAIELHAKIAAHIAQLKNPEPKIRAEGADALSEDFIWYYLQRIEGGSEQTMEKLAKPAALALIKTLDDESLYVRWRAITALGVIGPEAKDAVPKLLDILKDTKLDEENQVLLAAIGALAEIGGADAERAVPYLLKLVEAKDRSLRDHPARALGELGRNDKRVVPALLRLLKDPDRYVQGNAAAALGKLGNEPERCVSALIELLKNYRSFEGWDDPRPGALQGLEYFGAKAKSAVPILLEIVKDPKATGSLQRKAIRVLREIGPEAKEAIPVLYRLLEDLRFTEGAAEALEAIERKAPRD